MNKPEKIISEFKNEISSLMMNYLRGNIFVDPNARDNPQLAEQKISEFAQKVLEVFNHFNQKYSEFVNLIKNYRFWNNANDIPDAIINFENLQFYFPFYWNKIWPKPLHLIPVTFNNCTFRQDFYFYDTDASSLAIINSIPSKYPKFSLKNIKIEGIYFRSINTSHYIFKNVEISNELIVNNRNIQTQLYCEGVISKKFVFGGSLGLFSIDNDSKIDELILEKGTAFYESRINPEKIDDIKSKKSGFYVENSILTNSDFQKVVFESPTLFSNVIFNGEINFNNCKFEKTTIFEEVIFKKSPKFHMTEFHQDTDFSTAKFLDFQSPTAYRDYSTLKHHMMKLDADSEAHRFHAHELKSRFNTILKKRCWFDIERFSSWFFKITSDYHQNLFLPLIWLLLITVIFMGIYNYNDAITCVDKVWDRNAWLSKICVNPTKRNSVYALHQTIAPFTALLENNPWNIQTYAMKFMSFIHSTLSTLIFFLWILGIRKRFKL